jgi:hypothetical protein
MAKAPITKALVEEDEKPLDPAMEKVRRKMIRLLGVSIGVMMAGLMAVLFAIVYKMNSGGTAKTVVATASAGSVPDTGEIVLPEGAYLNGQSLSGDRLALDVTLKGGAREIHIFDMAQQKIIARYGVKSQ